MKGITSFAAYTLALMLFSQITLAITLDQAKKETAHIKSLNQAKAFMYFNPNAVYRKALSNKLLTVAQSEKCSTYNDYRKTTKIESFDHTWNDKGGTEKSAKYNGDGRLIYVPTKNKPDDYRKYSYNSDGTLKAEKIRITSSFEFDGKMHYGDEEYKSNYQYKGGKLISVTTKQHDYINGTVETVLKVIEYDDDFNEYCALKQGQKGNLKNKICYDYKFNKELNEYYPEYLGYMRRTVTHELNEHGDSIRSKTVDTSITDPTARITRSKTCEFDYTKRKFQFFGN